MPSILVIAIGGNSLIKDPRHQSVPDQYGAIVETVRHVADLLEAGHRIVLTHGNGPQVGFILRRSELARGVLHEVPLDSIVADTQGALGYQLQQALQNELRRRGRSRPVATLVTQTLVDRADPAFLHPTKPVGEFYTDAQADERRSVDGWQLVADAGRGWRRVVPSPRPLRVIEGPVVRRLVEDECVVIAAGGGGIPVVSDDQGLLHGVAAVIDKDLAAAVLAGQLGADRLVIATAVDRVRLDFGTSRERPLDEVTVAEASRYAAEGQFAEGSMLPKVEACIRFVEQGGAGAVITHAARIAPAVAGQAGTRFVADRR